MPFRIGHGYDVHRFAPQEEADASLTLGGIRLAHPRRLLAHSDGDVLVHALCDALLGALALGDIGRHFPDSDPRYHNCDSLTLLLQVLVLVRARGWQPANCDMTVIAQAPKIAPHAAAMQTRLAAVMQLDADCISIKATTTEGLGFAGRQEGIACHAVVLLQRDAG